MPKQPPPQPPQRPGGQSWGQPPPQPPWQGAPPPQAPYSAPPGQQPYPPPYQTPYRQPYAAPPQYQQQYQPPGYYPPQTPPPKKGLPAIAIIGIVVGGLFLLLIILGTIGAATGGTKSATATPVRNAVVTPTSAPARPTATQPNVAANSFLTPPPPATQPLPKTPTPLIAQTPVAAAVIAATATSAPKPPTNTPAPKPPSNTPAPKPGTDVRVPLAQRNQGTQEGQRVTIVKITDGAKSSNEFEQPNPGNKYIVMNVLIENVGGKEITPGDWKLRTNTDFEYGTTIAIGFGDSLPYTSVTSGGKIQGTIVFEVPAAEKGKWLKYDPNLFTPGDLYFDFAQ